MWDLPGPELEPVSPALAGRFPTTAPPGKPLFNFLRNCQTIFQSCCTILPSYQQCVRVLISSPSHQHLLLSVFLVLAILVGMKWWWWHIVVLNCISLMTNNVEYLHVLTGHLYYLLWRNVCSEVLAIFFLIEL